MNAVIISVPLKMRELLKSRHSQKRMSQRGIRKNAIEAVMKFGRIVRGKGCHRFFLGHKEVKQWASKGVDLKAHLNLHVVTDVHETTVLTVYRDSRTRLPGYSRNASQ